MDLLINPGKPLRGEISMPGDKSISHRAVLFAALAEGESRVENFLLAGVTRPLLDGLTALGVRWELARSLEKTAAGGPAGPVETAAGTLFVEGKGFDGLLPPESPINCGSSGTTMRFLAGALAAAGIHGVLDGSSGLRRRPMSRLVDPLRQMGVPIWAADGGCAPLTLEGRPPQSRLHALDYRLPMASAQVKTALILAALRADGPSRFREPHLSRDHTERMLRAMRAGIAPLGRDSEESGVGVEVNPLSAALSPLRLRIPGDFSSAAFVIAAALITPGSEIVIRGVGLNPTRTGFLRVLEQMGASIRISQEARQGGEPYGDLLVGHSRLQGVRVAGAAVVRMIDEFPAFGALAAYASGLSEVVQAGELRHKESDRIASLCREMGALGGEIHERPDGFIVTGGEALQGGLVRPHGDHRLEMALAVAGLAARSPTRIQDAGFYSESYPGFLEALGSLGADIRAV